jgi:pyruvate kinase
MTKKILVTLGPSSLSEGIVKKCADHGVYVFRINLSHTPLKDVEPTINKIRQWTDVPICLDSEGAQMRNENMKSGTVAFSCGDHIKIHFNSVVGDTDNISFTPAGIAQKFAIGDEISVDFNDVSFRIDEIHDDYCLASITHGGEVGSNKAADISRELEFDPLTEKDLGAIRIGLDNGVRHFALSFANRREDVEQMRAVCGPDANIICKIESPSGLENLEEIIELADEILIDRGDLSRRIAIEKVPFLQRRIIAMARARKTPVFVATNLLESMVSRKSPTRAEVNDIVSTLLMGADGLVLAAETAIGNYPDKAVEMVRKLIVENEMWTPNTTIDDILKNK